MKTERMTKCLLVSLLMMSVFAPAARGQECSVTIQSPKDGEKVGGRVVVTGKAHIPPGSYLWVLVQIKGQKGWWPQASGSVTFVGEEWEALSYIGQAGDEGLSFKIFGAVVNDNTNAVLQKWVTDSNNAKRWDPLTIFPSTVDGCAPTSVTVEKAH